MAVWAGCLVGLWAGGAAWWVAGVAGVAGVGAMLGRLWCGGAPRDVGRRAALVAAFVCLAAGAVLGAIRVQQAAQDPIVAAARAGQWVTVDVVVRSDPVPVGTRFGAVSSDAAASGTAAAGARQRWRLATRAIGGLVGRVAVASDASVTIFGDGPGWSTLTVGQTIRIRATAAVDTFSALPGAVMAPRGDPEPVADPPRWTAWARAARAGLVRSATALDADRGGLLRGLVVGDTGGIGPYLSADAKTAGLTHLVAVSGTHMAVVSGAVLLLLRRFGPRTSSLGAAVALAAMVVLVGPAPSVLRSVVMAMIAVTAAVLGRPRAALPALAAAVFALLLVDPTLAVSAGFALSVQATAALILLAPPWARALQRRGVPPGWATLISLPIAAHIATMPVIAAISGAVSLVAVPANILVAPIVAPALLMGLACLVVGPWWPPAGSALARADGPLLGWITGTAHRLAGWPSASVPWPASPTGVVALTGLLLVALQVLRHRRVRAAAIAAVIGGLIVVIPARVLSVGWPAPGWLLTACDVGQGDGLVLSTSAPGTAVVVDTGPDPEAMDACLRRLGVTSIALVVVTHLHADHVGGLAGAIRGRAVGAIGIGPDRSSAAGMASIARAAAERHASVIGLGAGKRYAVGDLAIDVLGPQRAFVGTTSDPNNDSIVLRASRSGVRMLLTGDIERDAQAALLRSGVDLRADVLKQPHHGSAVLLPEFVAAVAARVAVVPVGAGNDYGHPAAAALAVDRDAGVIQILRTDTDGDVQVCVTGSGIATAQRGPDRPAPARARAAGR